VYRLLTEHKIIRGDYEKV